MFFEIMGNECQGLNGRKEELDSPAQYLEGNLHLERFRVITGCDEKVGWAWLKGLQEAAWAVCAWSQPWVSWTWGERQNSKKELPCQSLPEETLPQRPQQQKCLQRDGNLSRQGQTKLPFGWEGMWGKMKADPGSLETASTVHCLILYCWWHATETSVGF